MRLPTTLRISEKQFMAQVIELAHLYKWKTYHTFDSRRSAAGYPDLTLVRGNRCIHAELKSAKGRLTPTQKEWLDALNAVPGVESYCWRPKDWDEIVDVLN